MSYSRTSRDGGNTNVRLLYRRTHHNRLRQVRRVSGADDCQLWRRYITKAGSHKFPERPHWKPERVVIIEFPNIERLNAWYTSTEYQPLMALRKESTDEKEIGHHSRRYMKDHCARATLLPKYFRRAAPSPLRADSLEKVRFPLTAKIALRGKEVLDDAANAPQHH
jgi:hypothetical protein